MAEKKQNSKESSSFARGLVSAFIDITLTIFFKEIGTRGAHRIPSTGPVLFVAAPHANQFVDPMILLHSCIRKVGFLIAAKSMERAIIGTFAAAMGSIPVVRPEDLAKGGAGLIYLDPSDPCIVHGVGTKFTSEVEAGSLIIISPRPTGMEAVTVDQILSDTQLKLKKALSVEEEKNDPSTVKKPPKVPYVPPTQENPQKYKVIPKVDQSTVYHQVFETFKRGDCVGIFPEGGSHDRTQMLPLKAGATIMVLGAMAANPGLNVKIVPCGLNYFHADRFRSRAYVSFGEAITIDSFLVDKYREGGSAKREACAELLNHIYKALCAVTVNTPDYDTLRLVQAVRRLYRPAGARLTIGQKLDLSRRFVEGYNRFKDHPSVQPVLKQAIAYDQMLKDQGIRDHQVKKTDLGGCRAFALLMYRIIMLIFMVGLGLPGLIINMPIGLIATIEAKKKAKEALASSTVKIQGRDVISSWKLLVALVVIPLFYLGYAGILAILLNLPVLPWTADLHLGWRIGAPIGFLIILPFLSYASVRLIETGVAISQSLKPLVWSLLPNKGAELRRMRAELRKAIVDLVNELGPLMYEDWERMRIVVNQMHDDIHTTQQRGESSPSRDGSISSREGSPERMSYMVGAKSSSEARRTVSNASKPSSNATGKKSGLWSWDQGGMALCWEEVTEAEVDDVFFFGKKDGLEKIEAEVRRRSILHANTEDRGQPSSEALMKSHGNKID